MMPSSGFILPMKTTSFLQLLLTSSILIEYNLGFLTTPSPKSFLRSITSNPSSPTINDNANPHFSFFDTKPPRQQQRHQPLQLSPDASELAQQKFETARSLSDFNDGTWNGRATSHSITSDVAAGITKRKSSSEYTTSVSIQLDSDGLKLQETFHRETTPGEATEEGEKEDSNNNNESSSIIATRIARLGESTDVDSVDGSYSLDASLLDLPSFLTGTETLAKFGIEHSLAVSDDERVRCFLLYGFDDRLMRVVICEEWRDKSSDGIRRFRSDFGEEGDDDDDSEMDQLMGKILGKTNGVAASKKPTPKISASSSVDDRMEQLQRAMSSDTTPTSADADDTVVTRTPMSIFGLVSGIWLGDSVIRHHPSSTTATQSKGFAASSSSSSQSNSKTPKPGAGMNDGFAEWSTGVQKIAMTYSWDYETTVRQRVDMGRSMGVAMSEKLPRVSMGTVVMNEMSRRKDPQKRMVYIDFDMGSYAVFILGSVWVKAPRSLSFSQTRGQLQPFHTELAIFQKRSTGGDGAAAFDETKNTPPEIFCSKMTRLYESDGKLSQAISSFFTLDRSTLDKF